MTLPRRMAGTSLAELLIVMAITGVVFSLGIPRAQNAFETARVDHAGATLRSIWSAQRMHWLEARSYAETIEDLAEVDLIEPKLSVVKQPFEYEILAADDGSFVARAVRNGSTFHRGELRIDATGAITGRIEDGDGRVFSPVGSD